MRSIFNFFALAALILCWGCSTLTTHQMDVDGRVTDIKLKTFFDGKSEVAKMATSNNDRSQTVSVSGVKQETSGSNAVVLTHTVVDAAVSAAIKSVIPVPIPK